MCSVFIPTERYECFAGVGGHMKYYFYSCKK